jgi:small nuclear ribonucleoprotein (snRNP)-like protein
VGRDKLIRQSLRERFIVTLRGGESFDGLLIEADDKTLKLVNAFAVEKQSRISVDGELYVPRSDVLYLQKPGGAS